MAIRTLTYALAAAAMTSGTIAQAAITAAPARTGASVDQSEQLVSSEFIPVAIFMLAILAIWLFDGDGDEAPHSP